MYAAAGCVECNQHKGGGPLCPTHGSRGVYSKELQLLSQIDRFGVEAILGRKQLYCGELRRMIVAENVKIAFISRRDWKAGWADWTEKNKDLSNLLSEAEKLCNGDDK